MVLGEIARVLPERVAGLRDEMRVAPAVGSVTDIAGVTSPYAWFHARRRSMSSASIPHATTWNGSAQCARVGARLRRRGDPVRHVGRNVGEQRSAFVAELVEEDFKCGVGAPGRPTPEAGVVVDHHDQVAVPALVGDLIDPDPAQPIEAIDAGVESALTRVTIEPTVRHATRSNSVAAHFECAPPTTPPGRRSRGCGQHRDGPRHRHHRRPMVSATDSRCSGFEEHLRRARVQRPPPPPTIATVVARRPSQTVPAPATSPRVGRTDTTIASTSSSNSTSSTTVSVSPHHAFPYALVPHPALPPSSKSLDSSEPRNQAGCARGPTLQRPTDAAEEPDMALRQQADRMVGKTTGRRICARQVGPARALSLCAYKRRPAR